MGRTNKNVASSTEITATEAAGEAVVIVTSKPVYRGGSGVSGARAALFRKAMKQFDVTIDLPEGEVTEADVAAATAEVNTWDGWSAPFIAKEGSKAKTTPQEREAKRSAKIAEMAQDIAFGRVLENRFGAKGVIDALDYLSATHRHPNHSRKAGETFLARLGSPPEGRCNIPAPSPAPVAPRPVTAPATPVVATPRPAARSAEVPPGGPSMVTLLKQQLAMGIITQAQYIASLEMLAGA